MHHYVYETKIITPRHFMLYYGKHSTNDLNDGYQGSGNIVKEMKERINERIKAGQPVDIQIHTNVLKMFETEDEALKYEKMLLKSVIDNEYVVNIAAGGKGGNMIRKMSEQDKRERAKKISIAKRGVKKTEGAKKLISLNNARRDELPWESPLVRSRSHSMVMWSLADKIYDVWVETQYRHGRLKTECIKRDIKIPEKCVLDRMIQWFERDNNPHLHNLPEVE